MGRFVLGVAAEAGAAFCVAAAAGARTGERVRCKERQTRTSI
jgi:hypothetical protein